jgi:glycosyltransferase involved in cell wall biosynthesis
VGKLRVLSIATLFPDAARPDFGGFVERSLREAAKDDAIDLTVVAPLGLPPWPLSAHRRYARLANLPHVELRDGLTVHRPRFRLLPGLSGRWNPALIARAVMPLARQLKPKLIDAQFYYPDGPAAMRVADQLGVPFIAKARGADISHWGHRRDSREQVRATGAAAARSLAVSDALKADMVALGIAADTIAVHFTGLDHDRFRPLDRTAAKTARGLSGPVLLCVGALIERKRQDLVIEALVELPEATLLVAGAGEREAEYRAIARAIGVEARVQFLGAVANADLPALYAAADVTVMPSESEGLANAWVESLACGTPLVITDAGGARELVRDCVAGRIVGWDVAEIAAAVASILANPPAQSAVSATVRDRFDWSRNGRELAAHWNAFAQAMPSRPEPPTDA